MVRREGSLGPNQLAWLEANMPVFLESRRVTERVRAETEASRAKVTTDDKAARPGAMG